MLVTAIFLLIFAVLAGVFLAVYILFAKEQPPLGLALVHGALVALALILTIWRVLQPGASGLMQVAAGVLLLAAIGGLYLFGFQRNGKPHPKGVVVLHALLGVAGLVCLTLAAF